MNQLNRRLILATTATLLLTACAAASPNPKAQAANSPAQQDAALKERAAAERVAMATKKQMEAEAARAEAQSEARRAAAEHAAAAQHQADAATHQADAATFQADAATHKAEAAMHQAEAERAKREMAERIQAAREEAKGHPSAVVPVTGNSAQLAQALMHSGPGVSAVGVGNAVVLSGPPERIEAARVLLMELSELARADEERKMLEARRRDEMRRLELVERAGVADRVINVRFGPTLQASLESVSKALNEQGEGGGINIVFADNNLAGLTVRPVELHRVTLQSAVRTLQSMFSNPESGPVVEIDVQPVTTEREQPVVTLNSVPQHGRLGGPDGGARLAVFRLDAPGTTGNPEDDARIERDNAKFMEAIEVGLEITGRSPGFKIKLHPPSGMMFVNGTPTEIHMVAEVLGQDVPTAFPPQPTPEPSAPVAHGRTPGAAAGGVSTAVSAPTATPGTPFQPVPTGAR